MNKAAKPTPLGVHDIASGLHVALQRYIEAQYHIRDEGLIAERNALLKESGVIAQEAFLEATPIYAQVDGYSSLSIPIEAREALTKISQIGGSTGLYPEPYKHQAESLEAFLGPDVADLVVATGTGSGKTESFLMPILGALSIESATRNETSSLCGCRALLLYPMNALVNDQVSRVRRLFGNSEVNSIISCGRNRPIRFGSYTGRTPYPGKRTTDNDAKYIGPLFEEFYLKVEQNKPLKEQLVKMGRWPSKDLSAFYNGTAAENKKYKSGKNIGEAYTTQNWGVRLKTQPSDFELMTRHEMQYECPDLLVTNYSMLEYMLLRPIEKTIFEQTAQWLASDDRNQFILVLDEAHMYRGAAGAEVALLIRRLIARLGITRERVRCILTSASLGNGPEAIADVAQFAADLTGTPSGRSGVFRVVTGTKEVRPEGESATDLETNSLSTLDPTVIANAPLDPESAFQAISALAQRLKWPTPINAFGVANYLFNALTGFGPAELLVSSVMGRATALAELRSRIFPSKSPQLSARALDSLLALCSIAKREENGRVFMPTRLHLLYRGLPGLYACVASNCSGKLHTATSSPLGRFHTKSLLSCSCANSGRVYKFLTHRDCGAAFLQGWIDERFSFIWHEADNSIVNGDKRLYPIEMFVDGTPHPTARVREIWLNISTGQVRHQAPSNISEYVRYYIPDKDVVARQPLTFDDCPACGKRTKRGAGDLSKIMNHVTKGEAPFSTLVRAQLKYQPATRPADKSFPNGGRKVLVFSDGRQKAARLARDMPRDMELDLFRQVIAVSAQALKELNKEAKPTDSMLYLAFLSTLSKHNLVMFDVESAKLEEHIDLFIRDDGDLAEALEDSFTPGTPPLRYKIALLKLLCSSYYSLYGTSVGFVEPTIKARKRIEKALCGQFSSDELSCLAVSWIEEQLNGYSFDHELSSDLRAKASGFWKPNWDAKGKFGRNFRTALQQRHKISIERIEALEKALKDALTAQSDGTYIDPNSVKLTINLSHAWLQCSSCTQVSPLDFKGSCPSCGCTDIKILAPDSDPYFVARKEFWRAPVANALNAESQLSNLFAEEHTAQLSNRDRKSVHSTTERHELRFQDILLDSKDRPIDVLSCTTTMEVGIDIGSLVAVALRNVPPQRENYQQRAGRAGRRGSAVSSVVTYSQNGPHDSYYFLNPKRMVSGPPRSPELKVENPKIARRHVHSYLLQTFFQQSDISNNAHSESAALQKALGYTRDFFYCDELSGLNLLAFKAWVTKEVLEPPHPLKTTIAKWIPASLDIFESLEEWVGTVAGNFVRELEKKKSLVPPPNEVSARYLAENDETEGDFQPVFEQEDLLEFLFFHSLLPSYAFPTALCSFLVEHKVRNAKGNVEVRVEQMPQQSTIQALSEYAPGRLVVINKKTYRSGGVFANTVPNEVDRCTKLFAEAKRLVVCDVCSYVQDPHSPSPMLKGCPVCGSPLRSEKIIQPEVFGPERARALQEDDREQEITYATMAQFPQPLGQETFTFHAAGPYLNVTHATDNRLLTLNKGKTQRGEALGFHVCKKCGASEVFDPQNAKVGKHVRPYLVRGKDISEFCDGEFEQVFLWFGFTTDVLLLRLAIRTPLITDISSAATVKTLESAAYSLAEALRLAASRHRQLDLDPTEFGSGHRFLPISTDGTVYLDVYLYDTLSGGAGYSELAAKYFDEIIAETLTLLESCDCDTSCTDCLDHFYNQHLKGCLNRHLAASLLRYVLYGAIPTCGDAHEQGRRLQALSRTLSLDGVECQQFVPAGGKIVPLRVRQKSHTLDVYVHSALMDIGAISFEKSDNISDYHINELSLLFDLPGVHSRICGIIS